MLNIRIHEKPHWRKISKSINIISPWKCMMARARAFIHTCTKVPREWKSHCLTVACAHIYTCVEFEGLAVARRTKSAIKMTQRGGTKFGQVCAHPPIELQINWFFRISNQRKRHRARCMQMRHARNVLRHCTAHTHVQIVYISKVQKSVAAWHPHPHARTL